ncbi:hypothetical protein NAP1_04285 [Erythrobacter sp. NAP1]|nr:hypothetical protein NAP1_04285 [Erythrobacter sp. NAP1]
MAIDCIKRKRRSRVGSTPDYETQLGAMSARPDAFMDSGLKVASRFADRLPPLFAGAVLLCLVDRIRLTFAWQVNWVET